MKNLQEQTELYTRTNLTKLKNTRTDLTKFPIVNIEEIIYNLNMSVRQIKKSYISCTGYFASYKNKSQIAFESVLERDFYMTLEFDDNVVKYEEQPMTIKYKYLDGSKRRYTPDTLVHYKNKRKMLYEIKYVDEIENNPELEEKLSLLKRQLIDEHNIYFSVFTDNDINKEYLENLKFLYKFAFIPEDKEKTEQINYILNHTDDITVKEILMKISPKQHVQLTYLPYVWNYVFHNIKVIDKFSKLTMNTILEKMRC